MSDIKRMLWTQRPLYISITYFITYKVLSFLVMVCKRHKITYFQTINVTQKLFGVHMETNYVYLLSDELYFSLINLIEKHDVQKL